MNPLKRLVTGILPNAVSFGDALPWRFDIAGKPVDWRMEESKSMSRAIEATYYSDKNQLRLKASIRVEHSVSTGLTGTETKTGNKNSYQAIVIKLTLINDADEPTEPFSLLEPARVNWSVPLDTPVLVRKFGGGFDEKLYPPHAFRADTTQLDPGGWLACEHGPDGRSSNKDMPFLLGATGELGWVATLEWSGLWFGGINAEHDGTVTTVFNVPANGIVLEAREELALPAVHIVFAENGGLAGATNMFRRYLNEVVLPWLDNKPVVPPVSYNSWYGLGPDINAEIMSSQAKAAAEAGVEYFVLDAGWYAGCLENNFDAGVGNWNRVDAAKFPNGLEPLAEQVRSLGMKFGLWFELERAHRDSDWAKQHPDWFIDIGKPFLHLNLAVEAAQDACIETVVSTAQRLGLEWIKLDYNIGPKPYWEAADSSLKIQFAYMRGLYRVLDELRRRLPKVLFETCASGGRRLDLAMLMRAHVAWISDEVFSSDSVRFMQSAANYFMPAHLNAEALAFGRREGSQTVDEYDVACRMLGSYQLMGDLAMLTSDDRKKLRKMGELFRTFRAVLPINFFALSQQPRSHEDCEVVQFSTADGRDAVVFAFAGRTTTAKCVAVRPVELNADSTYVVSELHANQSKRCRSGKHLLSCGLRFETKNRWSAWRLIAKPGR